MFLSFQIEHSTGKDEIIPIGIKAAPAPIGAGAMYIEMTNVPGSVGFHRLRILLGTVRLILP